MADENDINYVKSRVDSIDEHVSKQIRQRRLLLGISQQDVAKGLGLSIQQIQKYEAGDNRLSSSRLYQIARSLKTSVDQLFNGLENNNTSNLAEEKISFDHENNENIYGEGISERELVNLIGSYKAIDNITVRKQILELVKSLGKKND